ncbi:hypothetical protein [Thermogymnomonas acidicola]|uniref:hypothetical protein n=1 Tax=Thermogymnomonas acidicola TaxID=399579 RepID=UPI0009462592|nr:hypothetical protein [Thermogymnomonas acidicola]
MPGDSVTVTGSFSRGGTLNLEKLYVEATALTFEREAPACRSCGRRMKSKGGRFDYRCQECGTRSDLPEYAVVKRDLRGTRFQVPVCARRHLTEPLELEGLV